LLVFTALPFLAQEWPIPPGLAFLNKVGKPCRITYEPWTKMQMPAGNYGAGGVGKMVRGKHWQFPVIVTGAMTPIQQQRLRTWMGHGHQGQHHAVCSVS